MNFLQVTVVRILVKVSPGKKRNTSQVWIFLTYNFFLGGPVVLMTVHSMIKLSKETILNRLHLKTRLVMEKVVIPD